MMVAGHQRETMTLGLATMVAGHHREVATTHPLGGIHTDTVRDRHLPIPLQVVATHPIHIDTVRDRHCRTWMEAAAANHRKPESSSIAHQVALQHETRI